MNDPLIPEAPDFNDPLGVLRACHARMLAQCDTLEKLPAHIAANGVDNEARSAISSAVKYFSTSARHHHQDEEENLFPILNHQSLKLADMVHRLKKEHVALDALWEKLAGAFKKPGKLAEDDEYPQVIREFCDLYRQHINFENKELLSIAQHILSHSELEDIGDAMAKRRGLRRVPPGDS